MKKLFTLVSVIVVLAMLLSACAKPTPVPTAAPTEAPVQTEAPTPAPTEVPLGPLLKIGMITSASGAMSLYSLQQQRGFELGLEYASGGKKDAEGHWVIANRPVEVIVKDDELNAEKGVALARELIEKDGVEILQGPVSSAIAVALTTVALENKMILMIDPAASAFTTGASFNPYVFRTSRTSYDDTMVIAKYLVENVGKNFAHIYIDNAFGQGSEVALEFAVGQYGGTVTTPIPAPADTTDYTAYIQKAMDSGAECLFLTWSGIGYVQLFKQLTELGTLEKMTVSTGFGDNASFAAVYGDAVGTVGLNVYHYTVPTNPVNDFLVERHLADFGEPPDLFTAGGMASAIALAAALEKTGGDATGDSMIPALEGLTFEGPKGTYHIRPGDHVCEQPMNILKLVNVNPDSDGDGKNDYKFFETIYVSKFDELGIPCTLTGDYLSRCDLNK
jgi:branched-chain amino acid transport system substrate-binding protein